MRADPTAQNMHKQGKVTLNRTRSKETEDYRRHGSYTDDDYSNHLLRYEWLSRRLQRAITAAAHFDLLLPVAAGWVK